MSRTNLIICVGIVCAVAFSITRYLTLSQRACIPSIPLNRTSPTLHPAQMILLGGKIDINTADAEAFEVLEGIGPVRASCIVKDRHVNGPFGAVDELRRVYGIGQKTIEKNGYYLKVVPQSATLSPIVDEATLASGNDDDT